jgi:hypothetical protein
MTEMESDNDFLGLNDIKKYFILQYSEFYLRITLKYINGMQILQSNLENSIFFKAASKDC